MDNAIVYLIGHYGVGKLTVAKALCARTHARLVDNHSVNNVIFAAVRAEGKRLPLAVWTYVERVREATFEAIEALAPPAESYVLTNSLDDTPGDRRWYERVVLLAERRGALFVPVVVTCGEEENLRRIPMPDRAANLKSTNVERARERLHTLRVLPINHPNSFRLDTTSASPDQSAEAIERHTASLR
jgi:hypothetical protein